MMALERPSNIAAEALTIIQHNGMPHWFLQVSGDKAFSFMGAVDTAEGPEVFTLPPD